MKKKFEKGDLVLFQIDYGNIFCCDLIIIHEDWGYLKKIETEQHEKLYMMFTGNSSLTLIEKGAFK